MKINTRYVAFLGILMTFALAAGYLERLIPIAVIAVPGIRLGLPNLAVIILMYIKDYKTAFILNILRVVIMGLLFTGVWGMVYGLSGALLSFAVMAALKKTGKFGTAGVSAAGGVFHNLGQICLAALLVSNIKLFYYFPVLIISGATAGVVIGYLAGLMINRLTFLFTEKEK
jgi:heptaprenyl diphosphate synthase